MKHRIPAVFPLSRRHANHSRSSYGIRVGPGECRGLKAAMLAGTLAIACGSPTATGQTFLGLVPPGDVPVPFAPESFGEETLPHSRLIFAPDGRTLYWNGNPSVGEEAVLFSSTFDGAILSRPTRVPPAPPFVTSRIEFSEAGDRLFFFDPGGGERPFMAYVERTESGWSEPVTIIPNDDGAWAALGQPSLTRDGVVYFTGRRAGESVPRIFAARPMGGGYGEPEALPEHVNLNAALDPYVDPDEQFLLFVAAGRSGNVGGLDVWVCYRETGGNWSQPEPVVSVNSEHIERFPSVSADGRYLFFVRSPGNTFFPNEGTAFYWVSTEGLGRLGG